MQKNTLNFIANSLANSFGPYGSNTCIKKDNVLNEYTKDGHTILQNIFFTGSIEHSVKEDLEAITRNIVKKVGDGTTSAVILSSLIFDELCKMEDESSKMPFQIIKEFSDTVDKISSIVRYNGRECTLEDIYDIAYTSTNGDDDIANRILQIYQNFGMNVFVDVTTSIGSETLIKIYDGMTLDAPYADNAFINDIENGVSKIRNPKIYAFEDPIDTPEMATYFMKILSDNIMNPYADNETMVPTVIMCPKLSRDVVTSMDQLVDFLYKFDKNGQTMEKPPVLVITNIYDKEKMMDLARLCGCPMIKKYIDPIMQEMDIQKHLAPTIDNITDFCGSADLVQADDSKTKFVNPALMHDKDGNESTLFKSMVAALESELKRAQDNGENATVTGPLKRRINSMKANMVEYLVGGITSADRDSKLALVEDAVLNCRSAAENGVGMGANYEGFKASYKLLKNDDSIMATIIFKSYSKLAKILYESMGKDERTAQEIAADSLDKNSPLNLRTEEFDQKVLTSIEADIVILEGIAKIITIMFTCNQYLCQTPLHNMYIDEDDIK